MTANPERHLETVKSLDFISALAAAQRGGKWDAIKTLTSPEQRIRLSDCAPRTLAIGRGSRLSGIHHAQCHGCPGTIYAASWRS